jgi:hypothetical protein
VHSGNGPRLKRRSVCNKNTYLAIKNTSNGLFCNFITRLEA